MFSAIPFGGAVAALMFTVVVFGFARFFWRRRKKRELQYLIAERRFDAAAVVWQSLGKPTRVTFGDLQGQNGYAFGLYLVDHGWVERRVGDQNWTPSLWGHLSSETTVTTE